MWDVLLKICVEVSDYPDQTGRTMIHSMPILLTRYVQEQLMSRVDSLSSAEAAKANAILKQLSDLRAYYEGHRDEYRIGFGPIEKLFQEVQNGETPPEQAEDKAAQPAVASMLGPLYVNALSAFDLKIARNGQWRDAALMQKLLIHAIHAFKQFGSIGDAAYSAVFDWIEIVHIYVLELPDPRLFRNAIEEGEAVISEAQEGGKIELVGDVCHRLGTLYLDPYGARSSQNYDQQIAQWRWRFHDHMGPQIASLPEQDREMPQPMDALEKAEHYHSRAAKLRPKDYRGFSLKALAQAVHWQIFLGKKNRKADVQKICGEALQMLSPDESPQEWVSVLNLRSSGADASEREILTRILAVSWDSHVTKIGQSYTLDLISQSAQFFLNTGAPERALCDY